MTVNSPIGLQFLGLTKIFLKLGLMLLRWARIALLLLFRLVCGCLFLATCVTGTLGVAATADLLESSILSSTTSVSGWTSGPDSLRETTGGSIGVNVVGMAGRDFVLLYGWLRSELITCTLFVYFKIWVLFFGVFF